MDPKHPVHRVRRWRRSSNLRRTCPLLDEAGSPSRLSSSAPPRRLVRSVARGTSHVRSKRAMPSRYGWSPDPGNVWRRATRDIVEEALVSVQPDDELAVAEGDDKQPS